MASPSFSDLFARIRSSPADHATTSAKYQDLKRSAQSLVDASALRDTNGAPVDFGPFGKITFPYHKMGAIDSLDLFGIDELTLFAYYDANRSRYRRGLDIGANIGLHSIVMSKCGFEVTAYEPDPVHFALLRRNLSINGAASVKPVEAAVSNRCGVTEFVRVLGNTTGSHIAGAKAAPYGELERFDVRVDDVAELAGAVDLIKLDAEGHEVEILLGIPTSEFSHCDVILEVGTPVNAQRIYERFHDSGLNLFSQKTGWGRVESPTGVPTSHKEGSLYITRSPVMMWA